ncbi:MAG: hypothetical protein AAF420_07535, partial [Pseudomonadota bacterium]
RYWRDAGFVELFPIVRPSVIAGKSSGTSIFLKVPKAGTISTSQVAGENRYTLKFPPGTIADRVSYRLYRKSDGEIGGAVNDVRGTRWDSDGREYFHVYRPTGVAPDMPLVGYEWPRGDRAAQRSATELLVDHIRKTPKPITGGFLSRSDVRRFRALNNCAACHIANKPMAQQMHSRLPPWPTDASGLFVPGSVLLDSLPLSSTSDFHDPNDLDPFLIASCETEEARMHTRSYATWFTCIDSVAPMGTRDVLRALQASDTYTQAVCASRRYLFDRLDQRGRIAFSHAFKVCGID